MKKIYFTGYNEQNIGDYLLDSLEPYSYFPKQSTFNYFYSLAFRKFDNASAFGYAEGIDYLYRTKNKFYMRFLNDFYDKYKDYEILIFSNNFIHPEFLYKNFKNSIKVLGFIDDPISTYSRGLPYIWAFNGVFYISPSYEERLMKNELTKWGIKNHFWHNLIVKKDEIKINNYDDFFRNRKNDVVYIGGWYGKKVDQLSLLKKKFGDRFSYYGRAPLGGYAGYIRPIKGQRVFPYRVKSLSNQERTSIYTSTKLDLICT